MFCVKLNLQNSANSNSSSVNDQMKPVFPQTDQIVPLISLTTPTQEINNLQGINLPKQHDMIIFAKSHNILEMSCLKKMYFSN